jgi:sn-1 stearoyl-lipid 9-desaturase
MMNEVFRVDGRGASALEGRVVLSPIKCCWNAAMLGTALVWCIPTISVGSVLLLVISTYLSLLFGHSVGMHRRLIHRSYRCRKWLERLLVYIGVLVGVAGPFGILKVHDARDWAQRQRACHDFFAHRRSPPVDLFWQLACEFRYRHPPRFEIEAEFARDRWYRFLEATWMLHQIPVGLVLYALGGWGWVVWGVAARVSLSVVGHWSITYWCHNPGPGRWRVKDAAVQASNLPGLGLLTYGECWHNNHHAFPESARIGLEPGQADPGWWVIRQFEQLGWVWDAGSPRGRDRCEDLIELEPGQVTVARDASAT